MKILINLMFIQVVFTTVNIAAPNTIGINGRECEYQNISAAIAASRDGEIIYISNGTYTEFIGDISSDITLVSAKAGAPAFSGCEIDDSSVSPPGVTVNGGGSSFDSIGGLVRITSRANVTFRGLSLTNATANNGGIIAVIGSSNLVLNNVNVSNGVASSRGGGVYVESTSGDISTLMATNSFIFSNTAVDGGAIFLDRSELQLIDGNAVGSGLSSINTASQNGGGIYAIDSLITISSGNFVSEVSRNVAGDAGGGIYAVNTQIILNAAEINNNQALLKGGGIYLTGNSSSVSISNQSEIRSNKTTALTVLNVLSEGGGGLFINQGSLTINNSSVTNNETHNYGGAIFSMGALLIENNSQINTNMATVHGGGIYAVSARVENSTIKDNVSNQSGGGIMCFNCNEFNMVGSVIESNQAIIGAGIFVKPQSNTSVMIDSTSFSFNQAQIHNSIGVGGGIYADLFSINSSFSIYSSLIYANSARANGAGMYIASSASSQPLIIHGSAIYANSLSSNSSNAGGAGIYLTGDLTSQITNTIIRNNITSVKGGGLYMYGNTQNTLINTRIENNSADDGGGGIYAYNSSLSMDSHNGNGSGKCDISLLSFDNYCSNIINNVSLTLGGGLHYYTDSTTKTLKADIKNTNISNNKASNNGTAIMHDAIETSSISLENVLLSNNGDENNINTSSTLYQNGSSQLGLYHTTIAMNFDSPLIVPTNNQSFTEIFNSIIYTNASGTSIGGSLDSACNNVQTPQSDTALINGISQDPLFSTTSRGYYRLSSLSPSIDQCFEGLGRDLDGYERSVDTTGDYDQGAFEFGSLLFDVIYTNGFE